jgi:uncharacterized protein (TIGR00730 family)
VASLAVFCGSNSGASSVYADAARTLALELVSRGITVVYGGGNVGLMGILADAVLTAGGCITGVIPQSLVAREIAHAGLTELLVVESMHERKALMALRADAFVALPGGFGTFEEFFEVVTWTQLGVHAKPCGLLNVAGFYDPLIAFLDRATDERFIKPAHRGLIQHSADPRELVEQLARFVPPVVSKWITTEEV